MVKVDIPVVVRLDGTNSKEAARILQDANISNIITATDLEDGAKKAVKAAKGELK
jgi:succinyl-CoA synthetase beta subunit